MRAGPGLRCWKGGIVIVFYMLMGVVCAFVCASMAKSKNREAGLWGVLGFFFGLLAVLILALLDRREPGAGMAGTAGTVAYTTATAPAPAPASTADEIAKWKALLDEGAISEEEFAAKKRELLAR